MPEVRTKSRAPQSSVSAEKKPKKTRKSGKEPGTEPGKKQKKGGRAGKPKLTAATADKYELYQLAVNSPETDVEFLRNTYRDLRGKEALRLREDFCGTAALAAEWIDQGEDLSAEGFDIDPEPVAWGKEHNFARLGAANARMTWRMADVRDPSEVRPDVRTAPNFSYWCFTTREEMKTYFRCAYEDLADDGIFVIDLFGGSEATMEQEEERKLGRGATYVWDQKEYFPGNAEYHTAIHFQFKDGTALENCFTYVWRFWNLTELRDILSEVGFRSVTPYFEGTDPDDPDEGDGIFTADEKGENCLAWIAYLVAAK